MADTENEFRLVRMTREHVPQVHALECLAFTSPWDISAYFEELRNPTAYYIVVLAQDRVVGFGGMWVVLDEAHVVTIAVQPEYRRHGLGRRLMHALIAEAHRRGADFVTLEVRASNTPAQNLYRSLGFVTIGTRRRYYPDNGEDAQVMQVEIEK